jgi:hypothetical protein
MSIRIIEAIAWIIALFVAGVIGFAFGCVIAAGTF